MEIFNVRFDVKFPDRHTSKPETCASAPSCPVIRPPQRRASRRLLPPARPQVQATVDRHAVTRARDPEYDQQYQGQQQDDRTEPLHVMSVPIPGQ